MAILAKYDSIDGEASDRGFEGGMKVGSIAWGAQQSDPGASGRSRRRGVAVVEDVTLTMAYDKASPKLQEKCLRGEVIRKLEIDVTADFGGTRQTYLHIELKNVLIASYQFAASGDGEAEPPMIVVGNDFEEMKVTYTEFDDAGRKKGAVETSHAVEH